MSKPTTVSGRELYDLLPTVYRARDESGDLARYLDACGELLDRLRATLEQRLADAFPASPPGAIEAQSWLLPYFADLLDVRLVSPLVAGRRGEVASAIAWRQRKGTLATLEEIGETVGGFEVEAQEGWHRVAVTPRVDQPLLPAAAYGEAVAPDPRNPLVARRHPALPAVTPDVTQPSRAIALPPGTSHPRAKVSRFRGRAVTWRQLSPQGVPCFPGSFEDASRRTPDGRTPGPSRGAIHPRRLLLFVPPPTGFFPWDADAFAWADRLQPAHRDHFADSGGDPRTIDDPSRRPGGPPAPGPATAFLTDSPPAFPESSVRLENLVVDGTLHLTQGHVLLRGVAAKRLVVDGGGATAPAVDAVDCLFDEIEAPDALVRLEGTTVMKRLACRRLLATDCLFAGTVEIAPQAGDPRGCVRYSRIPRGLAAALGNRLERVAVTTVEPIFFAFEHCAREGGSRRVDRFGDPGYGVLHPATPDAVASGAEDGGEMGSDHHRSTFLARTALLQKLAEFLPVGIEAILIPDPRLLVEPPRIAP